MSRILVAMSGGVDSSVAAALLAQQGEEAIGVTMKLFAGRSRCCSLEDVEDARRVAERLGIRFYVADYVEQFRREVMEPFADSYLAGRTPIPCAICNKRFKFDLLLERARVFSCERVATGHYARIERDARGLLRLARSRDRSKDQTYFLFELDQAQLARASFPVGELGKEEVRDVARGLALGIAEKAESQEICFVPDNDYARVVEQIRPGRQRGGEIVSEDGESLGEHGGVHRFTVGQRRGLGIESNEKVYVQSIDAPSGRVVVGPASGLGRSRVVVERVVWSSGEVPHTAIEARVQIRYRHEPVAASVSADGAGGAIVRFSEPVRAVAPGQAAVFYDPEAGEAVLGGGWIREARA